MTRNAFIRPALFAATFLLVASLSTLALAQDQNGPPFGGGGPGGPPPGGGFGGPGGPGGGGPGGPGMRQRTASEVDVPAAALAAGLKLSDDQKTKIATIQKNLTAQRRALMQRPSSDSNSDSGRPDPDTMRANFEKMRGLQEDAKTSIDAILTDSQKKALPAFLKEADTLRSSGIPLETYADLALTSEQKTKIAAIARKTQSSLRAKMETAQQSGDFDSVRESIDSLRSKAHDQAMAVLTDSQKSTVNDYLTAHPNALREGQGGPGGFGGPGGGGRGGFGGPGGGGPDGGGPGGPPPDGGPDGQ